MPAVHAKAKFDAHRQSCRLLTDLIGTPSPIDADSSEKDLIRAFDDFETGAAGMDCLHLFYILFRRTTRDNYRERLDELVKTPDLAAAYELAMVQERLFLDDMKVTTSTGDLPEPPGDFSPFFTLLKAGMLNKEAVPWWKIHRDSFANEVLLQEPNEPVRDWHQRCFAANQTAQNLCAEWPDANNAFGSSLQATFLVANCNPHLHALLLADSVHKLLVNPTTMNSWDSSAIYNALHLLSYSPAYIASSDDRAKVAAAVAIVSALSAVPITHRSKALAADATAGFLPSSQWTRLTKWADIPLADQNRIKAQYADIERSTCPPVPGKDGKLVFNRIGGPSCCYRWRDGLGCLQLGHLVGQCPFDGHPPPDKATPLLAVPPAAAVAVALPGVPNDTITDLFAALSAIAGSGSDVDDIAKKYLPPTSPSSSLA
jgi:hypothetical protein